MSSSWESKQYVDTSGFLFLCGGAMGSVWALVFINIRFFRPNFVSTATFNKLKRALLERHSSTYQRFIHGDFERVILVWYISKDVPCVFGNDTNWTAYKVYEIPSRKWTDPLAGSLLGK